MHAHALSSFEAEGVRCLVLTKNMEKENS